MTKSAVAEQPTLVPEEPKTALAVAPVDGFASMVERLAANPAVDVTKLERIIELQRGIMADNARAEYYAAFASMQGELPSITERGEILVNGQLRSKYARNEDIQEAVRPILQQHGFALSFRNEFKDGLVTITGVLSHRSGHSERDQFVAKADTSGSKNDIQALGSTRSYGQRYTTIALLNIVTKGEDNDGQTARQRPKPEVKAPAGFYDWWTDMVACADNGTKALEDAWTKSKPEYRKHVIATNKGAWEGLKRKASAVQS